MLQLHSKKVPETGTLSSSLRRVLKITNNFGLNIKQINMKHFLVFILIAAQFDSHRPHSKQSVLRLKESTCDINIFKQTQHQASDQVLTL